MVGNQPRDWRTKEAKCIEMRSCKASSEITIFYFCSCPPVSEEVRVCVALFDWQLVFFLLLKPSNISGRREFNCFLCRHSEKRENLFLIYAYARAKSETMLLVSWRISPKDLLEMEVLCKSFISHLLKCL